MIGNRIMSKTEVYKNTWCPEKVWNFYLKKENLWGCIRLIQIAGWQLLSKYLNGGIGKYWFLYPFYLGCSKTIRASSASLVSQWISL